MVFSSVEFLFLFLPAFLLAQIFLPRQNLTFVIFSLAFYFSGEGWFTAVVLISVAMNYGFGLTIDAANSLLQRRLYLALSVFLNLALLVFFKYTGFISNILFVHNAPQWTRSIHLPLGISFFTFHALSYLIDVYRSEARAERSFQNLALYILMFPQLIAGPILRYSKIAPQLPFRVVTPQHVFYGLSFFAFGLGQKVLIADTMAAIADPLFAHWKSLSTVAAWIAVGAYTFQIYFDFGGYSNMAIGLAMVCGFDFQRNFNFPYISRSITEFWRRWHISLSSWFRDYLYVPLGGNRHGTLKTLRNLFTVFLLCGLWHGAAWTFLLWGIYHGLLLIVERMGWLRILERLPLLAQHAYALLAIMIGWVLFRAESFDQAKDVIARMFLMGPTNDMPAAQILTGEDIAAFIAAALLSTPIFFRLLDKWVALPAARPWPEHNRMAYVFGGACTLLLFGVSAMWIFTGSYSPFIYFRF
jgi:alginate O-acetyltransferase complex protein AlgI